jgi:RNA-directed DNA polymerase
MVLGGKTASKQRCQMGQEKIFQDPRYSQLGLCRNRKKEDGTERGLVLLKESDTPIVRHIKIKAAANPHDPQWDTYFETRLGMKMLKSGRGRAKLYRVWLRQNGSCPACQKHVTKSTAWEVRHIVQRTDGGTDAASNLLMHHLKCRRTQQYAENDVV